MAEIEALKRMIDDKTKKSEESLKSVEKMAGQAVAVIEEIIKETEEDAPEFKALVAKLDKSVKDLVLKMTEAEKTGTELKTLKEQIEEIGEALKS